MPSILTKWSPVTHDFGLIRAPLDQVLGAFQNWHVSIGIEYARTEIASSLDEAFTSLLPLAHSKMRRLFVATHSDWVACFQNGIQGSDPSPAMCYLAQSMNVVAMRVCCTAETVNYQGVIWEVYAPESLGGIMPLGYRRAIAAANDGGRWIFEESGERFPFEQIDRYEAQRKRDRFTRDMLREYVRQFGVELFSDDFLRVEVDSPAVRLQQQNRVCHTPEFTLEQVVAGKPWQRVEKISR